MSKKVIGIIICIVIFILIIVVGLWYFNQEVDSTQREESTSERVTLEYNGVELYVGMSFTEDLIDEEYSYSEIESCAFDGSDKIYTYSNIEITVANSNDEEIIYSIYILSDEVITKEGIKITDTYTNMIDTYGSNYESPIDNKYIYELDNTELVFIISNDHVTSIEYILITE